MIDTNKLRGKMTEAGFTQTSLAKALMITPVTFYRKIKRGVFNSDEISKMIQLLQIDNPIDIFFADFGTLYAPTTGEDDES